MGDFSFNHGESDGEGHCQFQSSMQSLEIYSNSSTYNKLFISSAPEQDLCNAQLHCFNHDGSTEWVSAAGFTSRVGDDEWTRVEGDCLVMDAASYEGKIYGQTIDMESHLSEIEIKTEYSALRNIECPESRVKG
ncbi:hypothetical protein LINGRAHAP2_LOCUS9460, partial [Linum grandiflorum]